MADKQVSQTRKIIRNTLTTLLFLPILYGSVIYILQSAYEWHWIAGVIATTFYVFALVVGIQELVSAEAKKYPINKGLGIFSLLVLVGAAVFGSISTLLSSLVWAQYTSQDTVDFITFNNYYLWLFLDMLPGLEITETLGLSAPVKPVGIVAGLPIVLFRAFVLFALLRALNEWWKNRKDE